MLQYGKYQSFTGFLDVFDKYWDAKGGLPISGTAVPQLPCEACVLREVILTYMHIEFTTALLSSPKPPVGHCQYTSSKTPSTSSFRQELPQMT